MLLKKKRVQVTLFCTGKSVHNPPKASSLLRGKDHHRLLLTQCDVTQSSNERCCIIHKSKRPIESKVARVNHLNYDFFFFLSLIHYVVLLCLCFHILRIGEGNLTRWRHLCHRHAILFLSSSVGAAVGRVKKRIDDQVSIDAHTRNL